MKGVILTATGEPVATPTPGEIAKLFVETPKVKLNFARIFDFDSENEDDSEQEGYETDIRVPSTSAKSDEVDPESTPTQTVKDAPTVRPTRLRRPSIRASSKRPTLEAGAGTSEQQQQPPKPERPRPSSSSSTSTSTSTSSGSSRTIKRTTSMNHVPVPDYDLSDEENLPSPFLKRQDRERMNRTASVPASRNAPRKSAGTLRTVAVMNAANALNHGTVPAKGHGTTGRGSVRTASAVSGSTSGSGTVRSSIMKAQKASEEAKRALIRA